MVMQDHLTLRYTYVSQGRLEISLSQKIRNVNITMQEKLRATLLSNQFLNSAQIAVSCGDPEIFLYASHLSDKRRSSPTGGMGQRE